MGKKKVLTAQAKKRAKEEAEKFKRIKAEQKQQNLQEKIQRGEVDSQNESAGGGQEGVDKDQLCDLLSGNLDLSGDASGSSSSNTSQEMMKKFPTLISIERRLKDIASPKLKDHEKRLSNDELGFVVRSGPDQTKRSLQDLQIETPDIVMLQGKQVLLNGQLLKLNYGCTYQMVGRNGVGKSTLLRSIQERDGRCDIPKHMSCMHVEQEQKQSDETIMGTVLKSNMEVQYLLELEQFFCLPENETRTEGWHGVDLTEVYERMEELKTDECEARQAVILSGLGFSYEDQSRATREFSGGWRMRVQLQQQLYNEPTKNPIVTEPKQQDLLLLDEPTNHLDVHQVTWLEEFLQTWPHTVLLVSHDRSFLNQTTMYTIFLNGKLKKLRYFGGNYNTFIRVRQENRQNAAQIQAQKGRKVEHLKKFIQKFGRGHKKMAKQQQSRMKLLDKMQSDVVEIDMDLL